MKLAQNYLLRFFVRHSLQYTGLSAAGSKGTSESVPQSEHFIGYIFRSSDMSLGCIGIIRTKVFLLKNSLQKARVEFSLKEIHF